MNLIERLWTHFAGIDPIEADEVIFNALCVLIAIAGVVFGILNLASIKIVLEKL